MLLAIVAGFALPMASLDQLSPFFPEPGVVPYLLFMSLYPLTILLAATIAIAIGEPVPTPMELDLRPDGFDARFAPRGSLQEPVRGAAFGAATVWVWIALVSIGVLAPHLSGTLALIGAAANLLLVIGLGIFVTRRSATAGRDSLELRAAVLRHGDHQLILQEGFDAIGAEGRLTVTSGSAVLDVRMLTADAEAIAQQIRRTGPTTGDASAVPDGLRAMERERATEG
jgi:hypothetical protein